MTGISSDGKEAISKIVEGIFDRIALQFVGDLPSLRAAKRLIVSTQPNIGLPHLFVQAMTNRPVSSLEKDVLKGILESSNGYIQSLKNRTVANLTEKIDGMAREAGLQDIAVDKSDIQTLISEEFRKAGSDLKTILESETTKFRNMGTAMEIARVSASLGDPDPTVFFSMVRDSVTCKECIRLHTTDGITPSLWKLSELKATYGKRGDTVPSLINRHPFCRCTIVYLSKSFGFDKKGKLKYYHPGYDAYLEKMAKQ